MRENGAERIRSEPCVIKHSSTITSSHLDMGLLLGLDVGHIATTYATNITSLMHKLALIVHTCVLISHKL